MPVIPALRRRKQENQELEASLSYTRRPCLKKKGKEEEEEKEYIILIGNDDSIVLYYLATTVTLHFSSYMKKICEDARSTIEISF
jgi:hypothetical protein